MPKTISGSHGTCQTRAAIIQSSGFKLPSSKGMLGTGVYFWHGEYAKSLAKEWYEFKLANGEYLRETDSRLAIILADAVYEDGEIVNLHDHDIVALMEKKARKLQGHLNDERKAKAYDELVEDLGRGLNHPIKIVVGKVPGAPGTSYPMKTLGWPTCFYVRQTNCIVRIEVVSG